MASPSGGMPMAKTCHDRDFPPGSGQLRETTHHRHQPTLCRELSACVGTNEAHLDISRRVLRCRLFFLDTLQNFWTNPGDCLAKRKRTKMYNHVIFNKMIAKVVIN